jgi:DNA-binding response OmpR family regulator
MSGKKIVVVDDEPFIVEMITMFFELKGYTVHGANTGTEGLILVQVEKPDVLLLDLMLPDIEGFEVAAQLRKTPEFAQLPIVIISARTESESKKRAADAGANAYQTKPLKMPEVLAEVERVMAAPPAASPALPAQPTTSDSAQDSAQDSAPDSTQANTASNLPPGSDSPGTTPPTKS